MFLKTHCRYHDGVLHALHWEPTFQKRIHHPYEALPVLHKLTGLFNQNTNVNFTNNVLNSIIVCISIKQKQILLIFSSFYLLVFVDPIIACESEVFGVIGSRKHFRCFIQQCFCWSKHSLKLARNWNKIETHPNNQILLSRFPSEVDSLFPGDELKQNDTETVYVRFWSQFPAHGIFRGTISVGSHHSSRDVSFVASGSQFSEPKVGQLDIVVVVQQYVWGFEITINDRWVGFAMKILETASCTNCNLQSRCPA